MRRLFIKVSIALVFLVPDLCRAQVLVSDNFNDGNDTGWTHFEPLAPFGAPGTFSFPNADYRIQATASPDAMLGPGRAGSLRQDASTSAPTRWGLLRATYVAGMSRWNSKA